MLKCSDKVAPLSDRKQLEWLGNELKIAVAARNAILIMQFAIASLLLLSPSLCQLLINTFAGAKCLK